MASRIRRITFQVFCFCCLSFTSCHVARYVYWNYADVSDYKKFPADTVRPGLSPHSLSRALLQNELHTPAKFSSSKDSGNLEKFLSAQKTLAFLILRKDTIIYESYFNGYDKLSVIPSFSVAKSFVSAMIGIAVSEGSIKDIHQPVTDYLPELKDPGFKKVTLEDILTMRSGIKFNEGYSNPFGEAAKFYYGLNLRRYTLKLKVVKSPGKEYDYQSGNTQILSMVLEKATGMRLATYFEEKIWKPMGAGHPATWSLDSKKHREAKSFCCINAVPEDFALFGQLYLDKGVSGGHEVVPSSWVDETLKIQNDSRDSQGYPYTYFWRVLNNGSFFAKGILGQFIFVCPQKQVVIIRMGESAGDLDWPEFFGQLTSQL
ncbi:MAG: serine hydrolase [Bacteroidetes bacterium]|nr:serine hydrolase [Bacteroidota bacterium]